MRAIAVFLICLLLSPLLSYVVHLKDLLEGASAQNLPVTSLYLTYEDLRNLTPCDLGNLLPIFSLHSSTHWPPCCSSGTQKPCLGLMHLPLLTCFHSSSPESLMTPSCTSFRALLKYHLLWEAFLITLSLFWLIFLLNADHPWHNDFFLTFHYLPNRLQVPWEQTFLKPRKSAWHIVNIQWLFAKWANKGVKK